MRRDNFKHYYRFRAVPNHCRPRASRVIKAHRVTGNQRPKVPKVSSLDFWLSSFLSPRAIHRYLQISQSPTRTPFTFFSAVTPRRYCGACAPRPRCYIRTRGPPCRWLVAPADAAPACPWRRGAPHTADGERSRRACAPEFGSMVRRQVSKMDSLCGGLWTLRSVELAAGSPSSPGAGTRRAR